MDRDDNVMLALNAVRFGFPTRPKFLGPIDLTVRAGECWAIVGPNGAGKSTLLRLMAGLAQPTSGTIRFGGDSLHTLPRRARARRMAFVPQHPPGDLDLTAGDVVLMGRFPHRTMGLFESAGDHDIAARAMTVTGTDAFRDRHLATLSGGETQRVHLAAALAQEPQILLLDEPTASLDLHHQLAIFEILRERTTANGLSVVVVTHDVNLAARYCSHIILLSNGRCVAAGAPRTVVCPEVLEPVYHVRMTAMHSSDAPDVAWLVPLAPTEHEST